MTFLRRSFGEGSLLLAFALLGSLVPIVLGTWVELPGRLGPERGELVA